MGHPKAIEHLGRFDRKDQGQTATMATKWIVILLFFIQAGYLSCCVFDKVNVFNSGDILNMLEVNKNECFAACYGRENCSALLYFKNTLRCYLVGKGEILNTCKDEECYVLQRDEMDPVCKTFVNF